MSNETISTAAYCGLYCGACKLFKQHKCKGCIQNEKASWCKLRSCCIENRYQSCADCTTYADPQHCKKFNNFMSKLFGLVFGSDRAACIKQIRELGLAQHVHIMETKGVPSLKRK